MQSEVCVRLDGEGALLGDQCSPVRLMLAVFGCLCGAVLGEDARLACSIAINRTGARVAVTR